MCPGPIRDVLLALIRLDVVDRGWRVRIEKLGRRRGVAELCGGVVTVDLVPVLRLLTPCWVVPVVSTYRNTSSYLVSIERH